jgi:hypothetical protein
MNSDYTKILTRSLTSFMMTHDNDSYGSWVLLGSLLMVKQPDASEGHCYFVFVARGDNFNIAIRPAWLNYPAHAAPHGPIN